MTGDSEDLIVERARVASLRRCLGVELARHRYAAGVSQGELAKALGRTRSLLSKVEHGTRGPPHRCRWCLLPCCATLGVMRGGRWCCPATAVS